MRRRVPLIEYFARSIQLGSTQRPTRLSYVCSTNLLRVIDSGRPIDDLTGVHWSEAWRLRHYFRGWDRMIRIGIIPPRWVVTLDLEQQHHEARSYAAQEIAERIAAQLRQHHGGRYGDWVLGMTGGRHIPRRGR